MPGLQHIVFRFYLKHFFPPQFSRALSLNTQQKIFQKLLQQLSSTLIGKDLGLDEVKSYVDFSSKVSASEYSFYEPYIQKIIAGQKSVMTTHPVKYFGKTAGTTSGKSKLIPITNWDIVNTHVRGTFFGLSRLHWLDKAVDILTYKNFTLPGGIYEKLGTAAIPVGDISAIMMSNVPLPFRSIYVPDISLSTKPSWEGKINLIADQVRKAQLGTISGVPTWHLAVLSKIREQVSFNKLIDLWPHLKIFFHGGVSFEPYRKYFKELSGRDDLIFYEVYNSTEGFFGVQANLQGGELLLLTDVGIFYEFIPFHDFNEGGRKTLALTDVKIDIPYVLLITTMNGLIRYMVGDLVTFSSIDPFKFRITGRTQEYINAFGEDLLLSNVENALVKINAQFNCTIIEYNVAPVYIQLESKGRMQFLIEFQKAPDNLEQYAQALDAQLQAENSNYRQKRSQNLALSSLEVIPAKEGLFYKWMESKGKLGGQHKIPRLVNNRKVIEELLLLQNK